MRITEPVPRHQFLKEWNDQEANWWVGYADMFNHINDMNNPHNVTASQVTRIPSTSWDTSVNLQQHTDNENIHNLWTSFKQYVTTGANVIAGFGKILLPNGTKGTRKELLFIDGLLKTVAQPGDNYDYHVDHYLNNPTEIIVHDYNDVLHDDSVVVVLWEEQN